MNKEIWKDIPGYEGQYQASTFGNVRSVDRYQKTKRGIRHYKSHLLRPGQFCKAGHVSVVLGQKTNGKPVHELVCLTFIGPRPKGMDICHKDGNPKNNHLDNLRYDTRTNNILDVYRQGSSWRKLKIKDVVAIKRLLKTTNLTEAQIAKRFNVTLSMISKIRVSSSYWWITEEGKIDEVHERGFGNI